jgi:hypothetical protein
MKAFPPNPSGVCLCGCGQPTAIMKHNDRSQGLVRGQPRAYIHGHHRRKRVDPHTGPNPSGFCLCGCGQKTKLAQRTLSGYEKGQHLRFISGHSRKGKIDPNARSRSFHRRNARKRNQFIEDVDRDLLYEMYGGMCGICKDFIDKNSLEALDFIAKNKAWFEIDHIIPLSRGGMHGYVNCQPAHPKCNTRKWAHIL